MMAKVQLLQNNNQKALIFAKKAKNAYPQEAQGHYLSGLALLRQKKYNAAYDNFGKHRKILANTPNTLFYMGMALEGMQKREEAARHFYSYLQSVNQGEQAQYAYKRLLEWGYIKPSQQHTNNQ